MGFHDFVDIGRVHIGVPDAFGIHHRHRPRSTAVEATGLVHTHLTGPGQAQRLDALLAVVKGGLRLVLRTAGLAIGALVEAEKDVPPEVRRR